MFNILCYDVPHLDARLWEEYLTQAPAAQDIFKQAQEKHPNFPTFAAEVFHRIYSPFPQPIVQIRPEATWAQKCHDELSQLPTFINLAKRCTHNKVLAGTAATAFCEHILKEWPKLNQDWVDPQTLRDQVKALLKLQQELADQGKTDPTLETRVEQVRAKGKAAVESALKYADSLDYSQLRQWFRGGCQEAKIRLDQLEDLQETFGWSTGPGGGLLTTGGSSKQKLAIAHRVTSTPKLREIAEQAGRLRLMAERKRRSRTDESYTEIANVELGNDVARLLPSEYIKLSHPDLKPLFLQQYASRQLLQYQIIGKEPQARGPLIIGLDSSRSMRGFREIWSKAFALALLGIAIQQKRHCRILHFEGSIRRVDDFPPGEVDPDKLLNSVEAFYDGGSTNWQGVLENGVELIKQNPSLHRADIVLVTDGCCKVTDDFKQAFEEDKRRLEFTCYGALIGSADHTYLAEVCDRWIRLDPRENDKDAGVIFEVI